MAKRVALVSGSTCGIGLGIANRLGEAGCDVIITGLGDEEIIKDILHSLRRNGDFVRKSADNFGQVLNDSDSITTADTDTGCRPTYTLNGYFREFSGRFTYVEGDLTSEKQIEELCQAVIHEYPDGIDILINNAGINYRETVEDYPIDKWHELVAINLSAPFLLTRFFLPFMKKKGWGRIVNIASVLGLVALPRSVPYTATKEGLIGMTKGVALECAENGVTCNAICPAWVLTDMPLIEEIAKERSISVEEAKTVLYTERHPTKQPITINQHHRADPDQMAHTGDVGYGSTLFAKVAGFVTYICSEEAASITGSALSIDAGYTAK